MASQTKYLRNGTYSSLNDSNSPASISNWLKNATDFYCSASGSGTGMFGAITKTLVVGNLGFSIPADAVVTGVRVTIERKSSKANSSNYITDVNTPDDKSVELNFGPIDQGPSVATWGDWTTSYVTKIYGGSSDTWGPAINPSMINNLLSVKIKASFFKSAYESLLASINLTSASITVYYDEEEPPIPIPTEGFVNEFKIGGGSQSFTVKKFFSQLRWDSYKDSSTQERGWRYGSPSAYNYGDVFYCYDNDNSKTEYLRLRNILPNIPSNAIVTGIKLVVNWGASANNTWGSGNNIEDSEVLLGLFEEGVRWSSDNQDFYDSDDRSVGDRVGMYPTAIAYGGSSDTWGFDEYFPNLLTPTTVNSERFCILIEAAIRSSGDRIYGFIGSNSYIEIYYTIAGPTGITPVLIDRSRIKRFNGSTWMQATLRRKDASAWVVH